MFFGVFYYKKLLRERDIMNKMMTTKKLTTLSVLTAFSIVLMLLIRFPIFPAAPYLEFEPMDIDDFGDINMSAKDLLLLDKIFV